MKQRWIPLFLAAVMAAMLLFSDAAAEAARQSLQLCAASVVPSLFPFLALSSLFLSCGGGDLLPYWLQHAAARLLGCSNAGVSVFFLSLLGGYPTGARLISQLYRTQQLSRAEAEHLLLFCNNAGPAFILGFVGLGQWGSLRLGGYLYLIHAAAAALVAVLFRPKRPFPLPQCHAAPAVPFSSALVGAVTDATGAMVQVCGFVTFFGTPLGLFAQLTHISHPLVMGFAELTAGISRLSGGQQDFVCACFLLGWGGLSIHCQTAAMLSGTGISLALHRKGKFLQGIFAAFLGFFAWFALK